MIVLLIVFLLLFLVLSVRQYRRADCSKPARAVFIGIRVCILLLLIIALLEPALHFRRLIKRDSSIAVLIDASASMSLFGAPESLWEPLAGLRNSPLRFFLFGDSLRTTGGISAVRFSDRRSYVPGAMDSKTIARSQRMLIVSDGNWSNSSLPHSAFEGKECWYLPLPPCKPRSHLSIGMLDFRETVPLDSPSLISVEIYGFSSTKTSADLICMEHGRKIVKAAATLDSGFFRDTVTLKLPTGKPGRHLYQLSCRNPRDSISGMYRVVQNVIPGRLTIAVDNTRPNLDARFLRLAIEKDKTWNLVEMRDSMGTLNAVVVFDFSAETRRKIRSLPPASVVVAMGCIPGDSGRIVAPSRFSVSPGQQNAPELLRSLVSVPPPSGVMISTGKNSRAEETIIQAELDNAGQAGSIALIALSRIEAHPAIVCAAQGIWRWDFWPLSTERDAGQETFSAAFLALVKNQAIRHLNAGFFVYPADQEILETDSVRMLVVPPATTENASRAQCRLTISSGNRKLVDTTAEVSPSSASSISFAPLPAGTYAYTAALKAGPASFDCSDSLIIGTDQSEFRIQGQNTLLLSQFAQPIQTSNGLPAALLNPAARDKTQTIIQTFRLRQSWLLLAAILVLFGAEWAMRKRLDLD
jgi:hypothetical protein